MVLGTRWKHSFSMFNLRFLVRVVLLMVVQLQRHRVTNFADVSGIAVGSSGVYATEFGSTHNLTNVEHWEEEGQSHKGSMSTAKLEKALGDMSQGDSMSPCELKKTLEELGEEEEVSKEECHPVPDVEKLVAIPEASLEQSSARRRKCRAGRLMRWLLHRSSIAKH
jgi:hypothetical protein